MLRFTNRCSQIIELDWVFIKECRDNCRSGCAQPPILRYYYMSHDLCLFQDAPRVGPGASWDVLHTRYVFSAIDADGVRSAWSQVADVQKRCH